MRVSEPNEWMRGRRWIESFKTIRIHATIPYARWGSECDEMMNKKWICSIKHCIWHMNGSVVWVCSCHVYSGLHREYTECRCDWWLNFLKSLVPTTEWNETDNLVGSKWMNWKPLPFPYHFSSVPPAQTKAKRQRIGVGENWSSRENLLQRARNQEKTTGSVRLCMPLCECVYAYSY